MRKGLPLAILFILGVFYCFAQTEGTLSITITTSSTGGNFAPKNIVAIWVEDGSGNFVKTLMAYAQTRRTHLNTWEASTTAAGSPFNITDAISGATRPSHATRTCTWNGTDYNGDLVADGDYVVWMELTDKNSTGNFSSFNIIKDTTTWTLNPGNKPSFSDISLSWEPMITGIAEQASLREYLYPNPSGGLFHIGLTDLLEVQVFDLDGRLVYHGENTEVDLSGEPAGVYLVKVRAGKNLYSSKLIRK